MNLWCKLWNFFLNMFVSTVHAVAYALDTVGGVLLDLASNAIKGATSALGSPLVLVGLGLAAWFLLSKKDDSGGSSGRVVLTAADASSKAGLT